MSLTEVAQARCSRAGRPHRTLGHRIAALPGQEHIERLTNERGLRDAAATRSLRECCCLILRKLNDRSHHFDATISPAKE